MLKVSKAEGEEGLEWGEGEELKVVKCLQCAQFCAKHST